MAHKQTIVLVEDTTTLVLRKALEGACSCWGKQRVGDGKGIAASYVQPLLVRRPAISSPHERGDFGAPSPRRLRIMVLPSRSVLVSLLFDSMVITAIHT